MTKTEKSMREQIAKKGFAMFVGKQAFDVITRMELAGKLEGFKVSRAVYNANGCEFRSQWMSPRQRTAYEIVVKPA